MKRIFFLLFLVVNFANSQVIANRETLFEAPIPAPTLLPDNYGVAAYPSSTTNNMTWINVNAVSFGSSTVQSRNGATSLRAEGTGTSTHIRTNGWTPSGFASGKSYTISGWSYLEPGAFMRIRPYDSAGIKTGITLSSGGWNFWTYTWTSGSSSTFRIYVYVDDVAYLSGMELVEN